MNLDKITEKRFLNLKYKLIQLRKLPHPFYSKNGRELIFQWIDLCEPSLILQIRNSIDVVQMSSSNKEVSKKEHNFFIKNYLKLPRIDLVIIDQLTNKYVGSVNINLTNYGLEIGKYIGDKKFLGTGIAYYGMISFLKFLKIYLSGKKIVAKTMKNNEVNIHINKKLGFLNIKVLDDKYFLRLILGWPIFLPIAKPEEKSLELITSTGLKNSFFPQKIILFPMRIFMSDKE